jgi:RNA polymerase-binding transcription factor
MSRTPDDETPSLQEPLSTEELSAYELRLLRQLDSIQDEVERLEADVLGPSGAARDQPEDELVDEEAFDVDLGALGVEDDLGYELREALARIRDGTFGVCESCGEWIARERLHLVPYARTCSACARRAG